MDEQSHPAESSKHAEKTPSATPERTTSSKTSATRPSRNRERISYSDFYKIGIMKPSNQSPAPSSKSAPAKDKQDKQHDNGVSTKASRPDKKDLDKPDTPVSDKQDKSNIIKFKVRNFGSQPETADKKDENQPHSTHGKALSSSTGRKTKDATPKQSRPTTPAVDTRANGGSARTSAPRAGEDKDTAPTAPEVPVRERAGTSPLSSVPSDLDEDPTLLSGELYKSDFRLPAATNGHGHDKRQAKSSSPKRLVSATDFHADKKSSKNKKIKISSPTKHRRNSPHNLELLPQDAKNKARPEVEFKGRMREDDTMSNDGHCSACQGTGKLLCCDNCPRSFHFICIDPPIDEADVPDAPYFCMSCWDKQFGPPPPEPGLFQSLLANEYTRDPVVFQLPEDIRNFFDNVSTGDFGVYQEMKDQKILRKDRNGFAEELDPFRLRDRQNKPILCYKCGKSPIGSSGVASCDYCSLHWHFDCVDPPLSGPPSVTKKWMCPLHANEITPTTRRPRESRVVDASLRRGFRNRGDVDVDASDLDSPSIAMSEASDSSSDEEESIASGSATAHMPRIKYRIPAKGIVLDFLDSCRKRQASQEGQLRTVLPQGTGTLRALAHIASLKLYDLKQSEDAAREERIQLLAVKALIQSVGEAKLMKFLKEQRSQ